MNTKEDVMKIRTLFTIAGVMLAIATAIALGATALAQGPDGTQPYGRGWGNGSGMMRGRGGMGANDSLIAVAAQQLGMTQQDLVAQLQTKTVAQVATDKNVALEDIVNAFVTPRTERMQAAVAAGYLTQAQADQMLATMKAQVTARLNQPWTAQGYGPGTGYVDADGDGVCDRAGMGMGAGLMNGRGRMGR
jgi:hypothetical protein